MSSYVTAILAVLFISAVLVSSRIHQTADSIVIEVEPKTSERKGRRVDFARNLWSPFLLAVSDDTLLNNVIKYKSHGVPANTFLMTERSDQCWMPDGKYGLCGPARSCFPYDDAHGPHYTKSKMFPSRKMCRYINNFGKEDTGVCCPRALFAFNGMTPFLYYPFLPPISVHNIPTASPGALWPWWISHITPTTESHPSKTSPLWVPDTTTTTVSPSVTSSPWWVPDNSTTTSPWWVPETSSTTPTSPSISSALVTESPSTTTRPSSISGVSSTTASPSSTTSPWWVPETSTATLPSTTSPWWIPEVSSASSTLKVESVSTTTASTTIATTTVSTSSGSSFKCGTGPYKVLHTDDVHRIVGGFTSVRNAWPFAVSLMAKGKHFCGGSLLDEQHILTAAHCVATMTPQEVAGVEVILGLHTIKPVDSVVVRRKLRRVVRHKGYVAANFFNDIAILKMDSPVKFSSTISPVCLPSDGTKDLYVNKEAVVVGWGALKEDGMLPLSLQQVTVKVQPNSECQKSYESEAPDGINNNMLCAAYPQKDSCMGDSGGPLVIQHSPGSSWIQVGIVSWGIGCARDEYPGVYVRTSSFIDWIKNVLN